MEDIKVINGARIAPEDVVVISKTDPMVVSREKLNVGSSRNLILGVASYDIVRHRTVLPLQ